MRWRHWAAAAAIFTAGCNRQDADALARIGQLLGERAKALPKAGPNGKLVLTLPGTGRPDEPGRRVTTNLSKTD
jgi:hypothetical protein